MREKMITGNGFKSDTEYFFDGERLDIYDKDACCLEESGVITAISGKSVKDYRIAFYLKDLQNVTLDFGGATVFLHGKINPFTFVNCRNITLKNAVVEYDRCHYSEAKVLELDENHFRIRIDKERFPYEVVDGSLYFYGDNWRTHNLDSAGSFFQLFETETGLGIDAMVAAVGKNVTWPETSYCAPVVYVAEQDGEDVVLTGNAPDWYLEKYRKYGKNGVTLLIGHEKRIFGTKMINCENMHIENLRLINGSGMGIEPIHCKNVYIKGFKLFKDERSHGLVTNSADAIHAISCSGDFVIEDSIVTGMEDDAVNIHSNFHRVEKVEGKTVFVDTAAANLSSLLPVFAAGDTASFCKAATIEEICRNKVEKIQIVDDKHLIMTFAEPVENVAKDDIIENVSAVTDITIKNSVFDKANSHLRLQSRGKIRINNCKIGLPILLTGDASYWMESSPVKDLVIENCEFTSRRTNFLINPEVLFTKKAPYYHENVTIRNCTFENTDVMQGGYLNNLVFTGNKNINGEESVIELTNSGKITAENCRVIRKTEVKTKLERN